MGLQGLMGDKSGWRARGDFHITGASDALRPEKWLWHERTWGWTKRDKKA